MRINNQISKIKETILKLCRKTLVISLFFILFHGSLSYQRVDNIDPVGRFIATCLAEMVDVGLVGNHAWVSGVGGLVVFDIIDSINPTMLDRYTTTVDSTPFGPRYYN